MALGILRQSRLLHPRDVLAAVDRWVAGRVVLIGEWEEFVQSPRRQLAEIGEHGTVFGDCDDAAVLTGALLGSVGFPLRLVAVGRGADYMHVFIEAWDGTAWWRLDPIVPPSDPLAGLSRMVVEV